MKLAIVGSRFYKNKERIRKIIKNQFEKYGENLIVVSGGCPTGGDRFAKDLAIEMGIKYVEFPPIHSNYNKYCLNSSDMYNKPYSVSNFFSRNTEIAEYCDRLIAFVSKGIKANGTMDTVNKAKKLKKIVAILED